MRQIVYRGILLEPTFLSESYISLGKIYHIFGARNDIDLTPYFTDLTLLLSRKLFPLWSQLHWRDTNTSCKSDEETLCMALQISIAKAPMFRLSIVRAIFSEWFPYDDDLLLYVMLKALSWIRFILLLSPLLRALYPNCDSINDFTIIRFSLTFIKAAIRASALSN